MRQCGRMFTRLAMLWRCNNLLVEMIVARTLDREEDHRVQRKCKNEQITATQTSVTKSKGVYSARPRSTCKPRLRLRVIELIASVAMLFPFGTAQTTASSKPALDIEITSVTRGS